MEYKVNRMEEEFDRMLYAVIANVYLEPVSDTYELASLSRTGTVNGKEAEVWSDSSKNHVFLIASFTCQSSVIIGDVDGDSKVDISDATQIQKYVAQIIDHLG